MITPNPLLLMEVGIGSVGLRNIVVQVSASCVLGIFRDGCIPDLAKC